MFDVCGAFLSGELVQECSDTSPCCLDGSFVCLSQQCLELCEHHLDGVEIWAVGRQEEEMRAGVSDSPSGRGAFVASQVVEDDDVPRCQGGDKELLDPGEEARAIDRAVQHHWGHDAIIPQPGQEGECLPMPVRNLIEQRHGARGPATRPRHVGLGPGLVDEDQAGRVELMLVGFPALAQSCGPRTILLARQQHFF